MANNNQHRRDSRLDREDMDNSFDHRNDEQQHNRKHRVYPTNDHRNDYASGWRGNDNYNSLNAMNSDFGNDYAGGQNRSYGSGQGTYQHRDYGYGSNQYGSDNYGSGERGYNRGNSYGQGRSLTEQRYSNNNSQYDNNNSQDDYNNERWQNRGNSSYQNRHSGDSNYYGNGGSYTAGGQNRPSGNNYDRDYSSGNTNDRNMWDRGRDEVSSWLGDEDAARRRRMDRQEDHRGRGPKGYKRSDERITEDINDRLSDDSYIDASEIEVSVKDGEVTLSGTVNDRNAKRRAEDIAESVSGVGNVENRIRMKQESSQYNSTNASSKSSETGKDSSKTK